MIRKLFIDLYETLKKHFDDPITDQRLALAFRQSQKLIVVDQIRLAHVVFTFLLFLFTFYDRLLINDPQLNFMISAVRFGIISLILIPFFILSQNVGFKKHLQSLLLVVYFFYGGFILFAYYLLPDYEIINVHQFIGLLVLIVAMFVIIGMRRDHALFLSILFWFVFSGIYLFGNHSSLVADESNLLLLGFYEYNIWFFLVISGGYFLALFSENMNKRNFLYNHQLVEQKNELKESNEVKNTFLSIITHDFKNLAALQYSSSEFLISRFHAIDDNKRIELIKLINDSSMQTITLLDQMVDWVKAKTDRVEIKPTLIDLKKTLDNILILQHPALNKKKIDVKIDIAKDSTFYVDQNSMNTILRNIISNAIKYSDIGDSIEIKGFSHENKSVIRVADHGKGMSSEILESIFNLNKSITIPGTDGEKGHGLGLMICNDLIKLNHGEILFTSKLEKGTTVTIKFPAKI